MCAHAQPYRKAVINPEAQASFLGKDHISKVREADGQETYRGRFRGWGRKEEISRKR